MTLTIDVEPLSPVLGAKIRGIDLSKPVDKATQKMLYQAFVDHSVLCFPDQELAAADQLRFANFFGRGDGGERVKRRDKNKRRTGERGMMFVSNVRENGKLIGVLPDGEMMFHSDGAHRDSPYRATTLYGIKIPSRGGNTLFANLYAAYDALSQAMKDRVENLVTRIVYDYEAVNRADTIAADPVLPRAHHRLVKVHPDSGRKTLYLSRLMTQDIVDLPADEGEEILLELFDHCEKPEFVYAHEWKVDDLLVWDNRCTNHARTDFPSDEQRMLRRYTVSEPDAPVEA
ncbi:MAG: taurine catabolism dioxygenase TauD [Rhodospirillaceae bacterium]|nr:taurine catabolism dioxygenase TauD [Rhodospirillaceae bacterium]|tara:strand:+ start:3550 stop:4410 length:861 start_codon:yes stop_codon:yes gene_type:complete